MDAEDYNHCLFGYKLSESLVECFEARVDSCHCGLWLWTSFRGTTWMHPTGRAMRYDKKVGFPPYPVASLKVDKESYWTCNPLGDWHDWHDWHPGWGVDPMDTKVPCEKADGCMQLYQCPGHSGNGCPVSGAVLEATWEFGNRTAHFWSGKSWKGVKVRILFAVYT